MRSSFSARLLAAALSCASVLHTLPLSAQTESEQDKAVKRAREQFAQALSLQTAGDWAGALALLKEVAAVKATPQVRFNIAICEEKLGRLVAALGDYELAAADARELNAEQVAEEVEARLESLNARIPKIVIQRGEGADNATIMLDGVALGDSVIGTAMPADPGPHLIEARGPGQKPFRRSIRLQEKQTETVVVTLEPAPPELAPDDSSGAPAERSSSNPLRTAGFVTTGVGAASLIASGVFFYLRGNAIDDLDTACGANRAACPDEERDTYDSGKTYNTLANVTLVIGAVGVLAGVPMVVIGSKSSQEAAVTLVPAAPNAHAGASLSGRF